jgi:Transposase IS116/IS110/IS902 family
LDRLLLPISPPAAQVDPGVGPLVATAIVAAIGNGTAFHKGREFSSWLGLVPRQRSTGGKARLFGISKRGNNDLRKILAHGARSAALHVKGERSPFGPWLDALEQRGLINVVITAAANKPARCLGRSIERRRVPPANKRDGCMSRRGKRAFGLEAQNRAPTLPHHNDYLEFPPRSALDS